MDTIIKERAGAYGVIIKDGKIALVRKANGGYKGKLDLPGGGIEHTESPEEALKREIFEEAGIHITSYKLIDVGSANVYWQMDNGVFEDLHQIGILYLVETNEIDLKNDADGLDSNGADWYNIHDLKKEKLTPLTIFGLEKLGYELNDQIKKIR